MKNLNPSPKIDPKTSLNKKELGDSPFNFASAQDKSSSIEQYSNNKKVELNDKIFSPKHTYNKSAIWILVALIICLTGLCGFTTYQIYNFENELQSKNRSNIKNVKIISGDGFSFVIDSAIPNGFYKESTRVNFDWIEDKKGFANSFLSKDIVDGEENTNGISVYTAEYDSKLSQKEFAQKVSEKLGDTFKLNSQKVTLDNGTLLSHISPTNSRIKVNYFTAVNASNYFLIKVYNQGKDNPKVNEKAEFTKNLLSNIRIN